MGVKLSIITINYNNSEGLSRTIESVINQDCKDFEYLVIDGGSNDGSFDVILDNEQYIHYWCSEKDKGVYNAMNKGIVKATGEYLLFLNSGDFLFDSQILSKVMPLLNGHGIVYGDLVFRSSDKDEVKVYQDKWDLVSLYCDSLGHPASFIKRSLFENCLYSEDLKIVSDWEFFFRKIVLEKVSYKHINRIVSVFDVYGVSSNAEKCAVERKMVLHRFFPGELYEAMEEYIALKKSPLFQIFFELQKTRKFQYRIRPILKFLLWLNKLFIWNKRTIS